MVKEIEIDVPPVETGNAHTSKGNQLKWNQDGWWYKADAFGYEGLAETAVSSLLAHSGLQNIVRYEPVRIYYKDREYRGCRSRNFLSEEEELIPLERLSRQYTGFGLAMELGRIADVKERIRHTVELVEHTTGISDFGEYLAQMLEIDAFFLNEDRHTNNIAVLRHMKTGIYSTCPFYDCGLALFSDTKEDYPLEMRFEECRAKIKAKPFSTDFDKTLDAAEQLYGSFLKFDFRKNRIVEMLNEDWYELYSEEELGRVEETLRYQAMKYEYMFIS